MLEKSDNRELEMGGADVFQCFMTLSKVWSWVQLLGQLICQDKVASFEPAHNIFDTNIKYCRVLLLLSTF